MDKKKYFIIERGSTSFCDNHITGYWKLMAIGLKRKIYHCIITFDNDLKTNDKYHCYVDYGGCCGSHTFSTNNFREAVEWMRKKLKKYIQ